mmetsp:Transcript_107869/g.300789  ORF Transcript_107869/g.300789 Transcript_107869/m.300789 type:complete len:209 (+) Transcript_107869:1076-1702(+)
MLSKHWRLVSSARFQSGGSATSGVDRSALQSPTSCRSAQRRCCESPARRPLCQPPRSTVPSAPPCWTAKNLPWTLLSAILPSSLDVTLKRCQAPMSSQSAVRIPSRCADTKLPNFPSRALLSERLPSSFSMAWKACLRAPSHSPASTSDPLSSDRYSPRRLRSETEPSALEVLRKDCDLSRDSPVASTRPACRRPPVLWHWAPMEPRW